MASKLSSVMTPEEHKNKISEALRAANSRCSDAADFPTDAEMLDWIEEKQVNGEWISNAIHWDGRKIRDCIAAEMQEENSKS